MTRVPALLVLICLLFVPQNAQAQFGKNQVRTENWIWQYYSTDHFEVYHYLNLKDSRQYDIFVDVLNQLELSYKELSEFYSFRVREKIPVIVYKTLAGGFDTDKVLGEPFLPEGLGGVTEPYRGRIIVRLDLTPPLWKQVITHELDHAFYFHQKKRSFLGLFKSDPLFFVEGSRAMWTSENIEPSTRDEIITQKQRQIASNTTAHMPTLEMMENQACFPGKICNPYTYGHMVTIFVKEVYGLDNARKYLINTTTDSSKSFFASINEAVGNKWESKEHFDEDLAQYWDSYYKELFRKPKFNQETENYTGRRILNPAYKNNTVSPVLSPDGKEVAFFSVGERGIVVAKASLNGDNYEEVFSSFPPVPYEYCITQEFLTWPFNGFDLDWSNNNKLAFFCKGRRDHVLVVVEVITKKRTEYAISLDQAFSPSFSPNGKFVYFAAAKDTVRDIYSINLKDGNIVNLTNDPAFDTAPAASPDGQKIIYVSFIENYQKLFVLDLDTKVKTQLTFNRYNDNSPSYSDKGDYIVYLSDEIDKSLPEKKSQKDRIWNVYTMNVETSPRHASQWTDSSAGALTPRFIRGSHDRILLVSWADRDFGGPKLPVNMMFEIKLKKSLRAFIMRDEKQSMDWAFRTKELFRFVPDENQINNPKNFRRNWKFHNPSVSFGYATYYNFAWTNGSLWISDILEENRYRFFFYTGGSFIILDYNYTNLEKRQYWGYSIKHQSLPIGHRHYMIFKGDPEQKAINDIWLKSSSIDFSLLYPLDKFNRYEFKMGLERRNYSALGLTGTSDLNAINPAEMRTGDLAFYKFFRESNGSSIQFGAAYVRDTRVDCNRCQGPYHGNVLRVDFEVAPALSGVNNSNIVVSFDARSYRRLGSSSLLALRAAGVTNKNPNGKYILIGGDDTLRGYRYGAQAGNQMIYASAEIRFPLIENIALPGNFHLGAIRGLGFVDYGITRFSNSDLSTNYGKSYGLGFQYFTIFPMNFVWANTPNKKWRFDYYISYNW